MVFKSSQSTSMGSSWDGASTHRPRLRQFDPWSLRGRIQHKHRPIDTDTPLLWHHGVTIVGNSRIDLQGYKQLVLRDGCSFAVFNDTLEKGEFTGLRILNIT